MRLPKFLAIFFLLLALFVVPGAMDSRASYRFTVPAILRPRVNFWIDIFTKYGKHEIVLHHRNFPQIVFDVVDLSIEGTFLKGGQYSKIKKVRVARAEKNVKRALSHLAQGAAPRTTFEKNIQQKMTRYLGRGTDKYRQVIKDKLIRTQTGIREKFADSIRRSGRYIGQMEAIFQKKGLPVELTRLPFIESSFDYTAYSSVGAAGIWQFMRRTAKNYMKVNNIVDQRRDPIIATYGAAKYLKSAYSNLGRWPEAITSYNHGVAGVRRRKNATGLPTLEQIIEHPTKNPFGFASTNFYPEFLAALEVYHKRTRYFPEVHPEPAQKYVERRLPRRMSIRSAAKYFGVDVKSLQAVNYSYSKRVWSGYYSIPKGYTIKIPVGKVPEKRLKELQSYSIVHGGPIVHTVRRGENLSSIANHYHVSVSELMKVNRLRSSTIRIGQRLRVPSHSHSGPEKVAVATTYYKVRSGDSLSTIASRHGTSVSQLKALNGLKSNRIVAGKRLKVPLSGSRKARTSYSNRSTTYTVRRGDSLWVISRKFGVSISRLMKVNGLRSKKLKIGQKLKIVK